MPEFEDLFGSKDDSHSSWRATIMRSNVGGTELESLGITEEASASIILSTPEFISQAVYPEHE